jgi:hypothetical protein
VGRILVSANTSVDQTNAFGVVSADAFARGFSEDPDTEQ